MLHFEGERTFTTPPATLWPKLRDAGFLADCIPDANIEGAATPDRAVCLVHPGLSFVRGSLEATLEVVEAHEPDTLRYRVTSKGVGSNSTVDATLKLEPRDAGTVVRWSADVPILGGLLKMVPAGLIRGAAQKVIDDVWTGIADRIAGLST